MSEKIRLGVAQKDITPKLMTSLAGYNPYLKAKSITDPLSVKAFVFDDGTTEVVMLCAEVCFINTLILKIKTLIEEKTGIPSSHILISATHTHSGPSVGSTPGWGEPDHEYCEEIFIPRILEAVVEAQQSKTPVKMGVAFGNSYIGINRREFDENLEITLGQNPWGPFNPRMTVVSFRDEQEKVVGNIVHYGVHCTCMGWFETVSRDWSGVMIDHMEEITGGITAFFNGFEGDVGPRLANGKTVTFPEETLSVAIQQTRAVGEVAAKDAARIYGEIETYTDFTMESLQEPIHLPLKERLTKEEAELRLAEIPPDKADSGLEGLQNAYYHAVLDSYEQGLPSKDFEDIELTIIRIGDVAFIGFPFEVFSQIGLLIQKYSKIPHTLPLSNANGSDGYFPTQEELCRGGYEILVGTIKPQQQQFSDDADIAMVRETLRIMEGLKCLE